MAWIKVKDKFGRELCVPEGAYYNFYAGNSAYKLVQESKPAPKIAEEKPKKVEKENESNGKTEYRRNENSGAKKSTNKVG